VEAETLACGTGAVASAILASLNGFVSPPVKVRTRSGDVLIIYFDKDSDGVISDVFMEGPVVTVYRGELSGEMEV
jgi:diaminopimelate epimerase